MTLKEVAKHCLPPIIADGVRYLLKGKRRLQESGHSKVPEWEYVPEGWRRKDPRVKGWNVESILETQKAQWPDFLRMVRANGTLDAVHRLAVAREASAPSDNDYAAHNTIMAYGYVIARAAWKRDCISILDWGGGIGHYYLISKALLPEIEIEYHCKDVPILCQGGRELLPEVKFYEKEEECFTRTYDLVLTSSSLQYSEDWKGIAEQLALATHSYLYITRFPIVHRPTSFVAVQRPYRYGYQTEYLCWFLNRQEFLTHMSTLEMELIREFLIHERPHVQKAPEQGEYRGFLFRPKWGKINE
jgi:putative methyltransferase (TIGR04325 family)